MNAVTQGQQAMQSDPSALDAFEAALAQDNPVENRSRTGVNRTACQHITGDSLVGLA